jgi:hypothetical protein
MKPFILTVIAIIFGGCSSPPASCPNNAITKSVYWQETRKCAKGCRWFTNYDRTVFCANGTHYFDWLAGESHGNDDTYLRRHPQGIQEQSKAAVEQEERE